MSHTPGPWRSVYDGSSVWSVGLDSDPQMHRIAAVQRIGGLKTWEEANDNALLIAAAPDMLAALKAAREFAGFFLDNPMFNDYATEACETADAAIAKAEGR